MPTVLRKNGFRFFFYSGDGKEPPHIHVIGRGGEMKIWLDPLVISKAYNLKAPDQKEVLSIAVENVKMLLEAWRKFHG
jgi:hypothetical protein